MCMPPIPRLQVTRDQTQPAEPRFGLLSAATVVEDMEPHAHNGVESVAVCDPGVKPYPLGSCPPGEAPVNPAKSADRSIMTTTADAFAIYAAEACHPGGLSENEARARLRQRILMGERHAVENIVYDGLIGARPLIRDPEAVILADGEPLPLDHAVGLLEQRMAALGRTPTLHAPRWLAPVMDHHSIAHRDGPRIRTLLGASIAFGSGYSGHGPGDADDESVWLYATATVTVRRSAIIEPATWADGGFDPATNTAFLLAERVYVVDWPCEVLAVRTDLPRYADAVPPITTPAPALTLDPASGDAPLEVTAAVRNWGNGSVELDFGDGTEPVTVDDGASTTHTYTDPGTYTVTATSTGAGGRATTATVTVTEPAPLSPPTDVAAVPTAETAEVTWQWTRGQGPAATGFTVRYRTTGGQWSDPATLGPDARSTALDGLDPDTGYEVEVTATGASGPSEPATAAFTTDPGPVAPPTDLTATPGVTEIEAEWTHTQGSGEPVTGFSVRIRPDGGAWSEPEQLDPDTFDHTFAGLAASTGYEIEVTAEAADSTAAATATATTLAPPPPPAPTALAATPADTSLALSWQWEQGTGSAATGFTVRHRTSPDGPWSAPDTLGADARSHTITGLEPATGYTVEITATGPAGASDPATTTATTTTPADPAVEVDPSTGAAPLETTATIDNHGHGPVDLDWGDGSAVETAAEGEPVAHTYADAGTYTATATSQAYPQAQGSATVTVTTEG